MCCQYFPSYGSSSKNIKVELDLSNYETKQKMMLKIQRMLT